MAKNYPKQLRDLGLPINLFSETFDADFEQAKEIYKELQQRMIELEESPEWKDKDLPWKAQREAYKEALARGEVEPYEPDVEVVQSARPLWVNKMDDLDKLFRKNSVTTGDIRRTIQSTSNRTIGPKRLAVMKAKGYDIEKLRAEYRANLLKEKS